MDQPLETIHQAFSPDRTALMPYFTLGYPDYETSLDIIQACVESGADLMELGIPFSDPLADGPTIQHSTQIALENGITTAGCLAAVEELRTRGIGIPFMLMGYYNPVLAYGVAPLVRDARAAGGNGFIIPDLPHQEAGELEKLSIQNGMGLSYLINANIPEERIKLLSHHSRGFAYLVSLLGVTGARRELSSRLEDFVNRVRQLAPHRMPLAVGFGISTPDQARAVGRIADGVIIGSALIDAVDQANDPVKAADIFIRTVRKALDSEA